MNLLKVGNGLIEHITSPMFKLPQVLFLCMDTSHNNIREYLIQIRNVEHLKNLTVVIYSASSTEKDIEDTFLHGANVFIKKPAHPMMLKKILFKILTINWQYHSSGLNRDNFILQL